jgi:hypothetical protein
MFIEAPRTTRPTPATDDCGGSEPWKPAIAPVLVLSVQVVAAGHTIAGAVAAMSSRVDSSLVAVSLLGLISRHFSTPTAQPIEQLSCCRRWPVAEHWVYVSVASAQTSAWARLH